PAASAGLTRLLFFQFIAEYFFEFIQLRFHYKLAVALVGVLVVVVLVIVLGLVEDRVWFQGGDHIFVVGFLFVEFAFVFFRLLFLLSIVVDARRPVLCPHIVALPVELGGVVRYPEGSQQFIIGDHGGVVIDVCHFGMAGGTGADLL